MNKLCTVVLASMMVSAAASAQSVYTPAGQYDLPFLGGSASTTIDSNGRLWRLVGSNVYRQAAVNSSTFDLVGSVDSAGSGFSISPDGQRFAFISGSSVRSGLTSQLSTAAPVTTTVNTPGGTLSSAGLAWSGANIYVSSYFGSLPGPGGGTPARAVIHRITDGAAPLVSTVATTDVMDTGSAGGLAARNGQLYWEYDAGFDSARVASVSLAALDIAASPIVDPATIFSTVTRGSFLTVDGNQTVISLRNSAGNPVGSFFNGFSGMAGSGFGSIGGPATFVVYNSVTAELIVGTNRVGEVALRFSIPAPGAAAALGVLGLTVARRRR